MRALVVDDSATVRRIIRAELEEAGYEVTEMVDGVEALDGIMADAAPDIMTLDMEMPRLDGFETLRKLRREPYVTRFQRPDGSVVPVVFVTSNDTLEDRRTGFSLGAADFVTKPFLKGDIAATVDRIVRPERRLEGLKALVADDSATARLIVTETLQREGIDVIAVDDGKQAFETICKQMNEIDAVITDLMMPEMDGRELCRKIRQELNMQSLPVIFLTAVPDHEQLLEVFKAGATDYLVKPFVREELLARLTVHFERTQISRRLKMAVRELRELNEIKDSLVTICSHDLKAPLNGVLGFTDLMLEKEHLADEDRENLEQIRRSGAFLLDLVDDILDLSKIQSTETEMPVEPVSLQELTEASVSAMKFLAEKKNLAINLVNGCGDSTIPINSSGIMRVLNNLLSNAIKYTRENGTVEVEIREDSDSHLALKVSDSGIGIPEEEIAHLFNRFTRVSRTGTAGEQSTGLGLAIVKEIIEAHNGRVNVWSKVDRGTSFEILLPRSREPEEKACGDGGDIEAREVPGEQAAPDHVEPGQTSPAGESEVDGPPEEQPRRILLAEDNRVNVHLAKKFLSRGGHDLTIAWNGREAFEAVKEGEFDIVFMDIEMPEMNGFEATRKIRETGAEELPVIALTAHAGDEMIEKCRSAGMNDFLGKPVSAVAFRSMISRWCPSRSEKCAAASR